MRRTRAPTIRPNWPRPERAASKSARLCEGEQLIRSPSPVTTCSSRTLSTCGPKWNAWLPMPPSESVPPTLSSRKSTSVGGVRPCGTVCWSRSIQRAPPSTSASAALTSRTAARVDMSTTTPASACDCPCVPCPWPRAATLIRLRRANLTSLTTSSTEAGLSTAEG